MADEMVEVSVATYESLYNDQAFLKCLMAAGVDNWDGYNEAVKAYEEGQ